MVDKDKWLVKPGPDKGLHKLTEKGTVVVGTAVVGSDVAALNILRTVASYFHSNH